MLSSHLVLLQEPRCWFINTILRLSNCPTVVIFYRFNGPSCVLSYVPKYADTTLFLRLKKAKSIPLPVRYKDWTENKGKAAIVERKRQTFRKSGERKLKITLGGKN